MAALGDPSFYPHRPRRVERVTTHISEVFIAGPHVYKLKRAVKFSFVDFSSPERRERACEDEVRLNARFSPEVYLGVVPITRERDGHFALGGRGTAVEHVVHMRTLPAPRRLVSLVERDAFDPAVLERLATRLAAFHAIAPCGPEIGRHADPEVLVARSGDTLGALAAYRGRALSATDHEILADFVPAFVGEHEALLRARQAGGRIRDGHGDLHAEHVYHLDAPIPATAGAPALAAGLYLVDCLEFSTALRCCDVASEVAFLAMDLERLGRSDLAARFVAAYATAADDPVVHALLPFYGCMRACVRALVALLQSDEPTLTAADREAVVERARRYLAVACGYAWGADAPAVIACAGPSGSGKSVLAAALAETTGFPIVSTDVLRKANAPSGRGEEAPRPPSYAPAARDAVYERLRKNVGATLARGRSVIADATFLRRAQRRQLLAVGREHGAAVVFVDCRADEGVIRRRLEARGAASLSDARWETYVEQRREHEPLGSDEAAIVIDTGGDAKDAHEAALRALWSWRRGRPLPGREAADVPR